MTDNKSFEFTYSAQDQKEIDTIRRKYGLDQKENKDVTMEELRRLDRSAERPGMITGLSVGIIGTLILGTGMSMALMKSGSLFVLGIIIGIIGIALAISAYPLYNRITKKRRAEIAPQIEEISRRLTDQNDENG